MNRVLDVPTISFIGMIAGISLSVVMVLNWQVQKRQPGVALWAFAYICGSTGLILTGLRHILPAILSIVLGNVLLDGFLCLIWIGIRRFVGKTSGGWLAVGMLLAVHFGFNLYYVIAAPDVVARIAGFCAFHAVLSMFCLADMMRGIYRVRERAVHVVIGVIFATHAAYNVSRIIVTLRGGPIDDLLTAGAFQRFAFVEGVVLTVMLACCLIIASNPAPAADVGGTSGTAEATRIDRYLEWAEQSPSFHRNGLV